MENGGKNITKVKLYACGNCKNDLGIVFRRHAKDKRTFPALVAYMHHVEIGNILFDTGYSELVYQNGFVSWLYNTLNKTYVTADEIIDNRLQQDNIPPESIRTIILSHAHPDHIGALKKFSEYELIATDDVFRQMDSGKTISLTFKNMIPDRKTYHRKTVIPLKNHELFSAYFNETYDIFGDGSVIGVRLDGHAKGQMGIYLSEYRLFFVADACWGGDLLAEVPNMRFLPRKIQDNFAEYKSTVFALQHFGKEHPEIKIIYSHGAMEEKSYGE